MAFTDSPDSIYAVLTDLGRHNLARSAMGDLGFKLVGFSVGRDGYQTANPVKITPINTALTDLVDHVFPNVLGPTTVIQSQTGSSTSGTILDGSSVLIVGNSFVLSSETQITSFSVDVNKTGAPAGGITIKIVKDDGGGFPSLNPADLVVLRTYGVSGIASGVSTLSVLAANTRLIAGTYHLIVETDNTYNTTFTAGNQIELISEGSGSVPVGVLWDGIAWTSSGAYFHQSISGKLVGVPTQKNYETLEFPTPKTVVVNCRLAPEEALSGLGEIGIWCEIMTSVNSMEIGTRFMLGVGHMPLQTKTRRQASLYRFIIQF